MRLLSSTIVLNLFFALFLSAQIQNGGSWGAVRLYGHAFEYKDFSEQQYDFIAKNHSIMAIEKRHARRVYGEATSEKSTLFTAKKMKEKNPETDVLFYWNAYLAYEGLYKSLETLRSKQPTWFRKSSFESIKAASYAFDFTPKGAREFWVSIPNKAVEHQAIDGVFIDALPKAELNGQLEQVDAFVEAFMSASVDRAERAERLLDELLQFPKDKVLICNGLKDGFGSKGSHQFSLAAYLIVAHEKSYYRFGEGHAFGGKFLTYWHEDFEKKIGNPIGEVKKKGRVYYRSFENLEVMLDLDKQEVKLEWK